MTMIFSVSGNSRNGYAKRSDVAFKGKCIVVADADTFFGDDDSRDYVSRVMENPTWAKLFACAKAQQSKTRDMHHAFFEGIYHNGVVVKNNETVSVLRLILGS